MEKKELERRSYTFEIRAAENEQNVGILTGRPIVYDSVTDLGYFDEVIARGALDRTDLRDVRFLVNHDLSKIPLARSRNNNENSTMQLTVDESGLSIRVNLDIQNNAEARSLYSAVERGDISGMSFMFAVEDEEWTGLETEHPTRTIKAISNVIEVSAVTFPAYADTEISVRNKQALENAKAALDNAKRSLENDLELEKAKIAILYGGN
ncbi:MAG: HK97 family phage prohead protease [Oscillospiraceae bacterium]|nr:HK97 family phage prohead protease [Oscillospiraceae bacterium]